MDLYIKIGIQKQCRLYSSSFASESYVHNNLINHIRLH